MDLYYLFYIFVLPSDYQSMESKSTMIKFNEYSIGSVCKSWQLKIVYFHRIKWSEKGRTYGVALLSWALSSFLPHILTWNSSTRCCHFFLEYIRIIYYLDVLLARFDSSFAHRNEIVFYSKIVLLLTIRKCIDTSSVNDCYSVYRWYFWNVFALIRTGLHRFS